MPNENHQATASELRKFLSEMRGKSPREMLGSIASSNLLQSTITATAAITVAIVAFTLIPFGLKKAFGEKETNTATKASSTQATDQPLATPAEPDLDASNDPEAANKLGIGEAKEAPSNVNPLDSSTDDLLEGLE
ncbi:MAG: hypothetical protein ACI9UA_005120 [Pseudoalteromonas tetraodonis]|jgi:hypothetical protein